ncbi:aldehyde dehydrogenase family protein [Catenuloplanes japonicus]|uniref:aldehyde dehydrogenase family protein n=1 Tax=Catenuloplanes japonicus TaxID=33876 RepID=UPI000AF8A0C2|nr:aldehyde dehydrogenase family protein [Catenuloplanes japonicus]
MLKATEAVDWVDPERWRNTSPAERLDLLRRVRRNIDAHFDELVETDVRAKGFARGTPALAHREGTSVGTVVVPMAANVSAAIELYESLVRARPLEPLGVTPAGEGRFDVRVSPRGKDRLLFGDRTDVLRVKGDPRRVGPYEKPGGIIAVLGAGNFASSFEVIRALFLDSCAVVHKPHALNEAVDEVWERVLQPLVDARALAFVAHSEGQALTKDPRLAKIYFTGGAPTAKAIMEATDTELVSECGGNNPCLVVPGDRPWTKSEIRHQALQIASLTKINGGAVCGRVQTLVTSRNWGQRREFLDAVTEALRDGTPADSSYYPGTDETFAAFRREYPKALVIEPRDLAPSSALLMIEDAGTDGFALRNEAFSQVISEVSLDVEATAEAFLPAATDFANAHLLGTLAASIMVDEDTRKAHTGAVERAVSDLRYGAVGVNAMPPQVWTNAYLTWGGNEEGREFVSGRGNFGNLFGYDNVEKSIVYSGFTSPGHMIIDHKRGWRDLSSGLARYTIEPTWARFFALAGTVLRARFQRPDF